MAGKKGPRAVGKPGRKREKRTVFLAAVSVSLGALWFLRPLGHRRRDPGPREERRPGPRAGRDMGQGGREALADREDRGGGKRAQGFIGPIGASCFQFIVNSLCTFIVHPSFFACCMLGQCLCNVQCLNPRRKSVSTQCAFFKNYASCLD